MGAFSGTNDHTTSGHVSVAIIAGVGGSLAFQNFTTSADGELQGCLTIGGDITKQTVALGPLPQQSGSFDLAFPADTDISLFDTVAIALEDTCVGTARIP